MSEHITAPMGRALDVLLYLASRSGPVCPGRGDQARSRAEDPAVVGLSPARRAHRARVRRALPRPAHLRPRDGGVRGRVGLPAARAAGDAGPDRCWGDWSPGSARRRTWACCTARRRCTCSRNSPRVSRIPVTLVTDIGVRLPAHLTASGRSILAHLPAAQVRALFPSARELRRPHRGGPGTLPELRRVLAAERQQGWAEEIGLVTDGLQSVAACAFDHSGRPVCGHQRDVASGPCAHARSQTWCARCAPVRSS